MPDLIHGLSAVPDSSVVDHLSLWPGHDGTQRRVRQALALVRLADRDGPIAAAHAFRQGIRLLAGGSAHRDVWWSWGDNRENLWSYPSLVDRLGLGIHCKSHRLLCALPPPFIFGRVQVPQRGMTPLTVVERLDIFEDRRSEFQPCGLGPSVQQLGLQSREEAFGDGVIESIADSSH